MSYSMPAPLDVKLMNVTATAMFGGVAILMLAVVSWWAVRHPAFSIARIVVEGEMLHNNAVTLRANVAPHLTGNFFTIDLKDAREAFEQVPWVRQAEVRREYPNSLRVILHEHEPQAYWGPETGTAMVNTMGEVFEANVGEVEREGLPRLSGPEGSAVEVLRMYYALDPVFTAIGAPVDALTWRDRGSWLVQLDNGASIELGSGKPEEVLQRTQRFVRTLPQITQQYQRTAEALEYADLRYPDGYALRLRGVTTVSREKALEMARRQAAQQQKDSKKTRPTEGRH
ncbi:cell division protein FtsQ/DivIB [Comamonas aquatica]|jgi:cell division protein FtsQ|uniref:Cell division protein FtsQ n=1 Tax=Comamonas aquatica TaxID=225991 RepID=A0AA42W0T1_9BURK|nr:cell division protein FtsQ/DivIB [Comamonas aquatica]MDE1555819.1 cell division protein FtsQ/DivIB [Comamonas aquatica]MDH0370633.1 cell division protein FtsQ/DivIB [Comamonas aquatica]MDH0492797.1 cell division protein FtsQ/DivIB [Comamonas aquatica]MDH1427521.1 cell division protein FtsQ/DivIB [Comamonas aquatica]MDH1604671.1 cell division protein FtsQ/DivIB [Comamonas aquatica]